MIKIRVIERNFGDPQVHAAEQFSVIERKKAKLLSVPERVPEIRVRALVAECSVVDHSGNAHIYESVPSLSRKAPQN
jgi:hypothetical protein